MRSRVEAIESRVMGTDRATHWLEQAASDGRFVRVTRRRGWDKLDGSIVSRGPK